jgi:hypothetical protein
LPTTDEASRVANLTASVTAAKQAVAASVKDGSCWYCLGNAYLASFFGATHAIGDMEAALKAYARAVSDACPINSAASNPDLYSSRAK